jgi:hypothetical protein
MNATLEVSRDELARALAFLRRFTKGRYQADAILRFDGNELVVSTIGIERRIPARGSWPGLARVPAAYLVALSRDLPDGDPLLLSVENDRLSMGRFSVTCVWHEGSEPPIELPLSPPLYTVLGLHYRYTDQQVARSGLAKTLTRAQERATRITDTAARVLAPLGVKLADLSELTERCVKRANGL